MQSTPASHIEKTEILLIEDEQDICDLIELHLKREGYLVHVAKNAEAAFEAVSKKTYNLLVIDWMLPGMSGLEITKFLRTRGTQEYKRVPILMVTARGEPADIVVGLEAGADDYLTKPFEVSVLLARVRSLLRRAKMIQSGESNDGNASGIYQIGDIEINEPAHEIKIQGLKVDFTPSEFKLLLTLAQNRGKVLTRDKLIEAVQGAGVSVVDRAIDTHVFGLRKKMGAAAELVETVRGIGYRIRNE